MTKTVVIVGGGLVGALSALLFAKRGEQVALYEQRSDIRNEPEHRGRSINLALSVRGIAALKEAGVFDQVSLLMIPMYGRMLHSTTTSSANSDVCKLTSVPYGVFGEAINSVDRRKLNEILLTAAEQCPNVKLNFNHDLHHVDFESRTATFKTGDDDNLVTVSGDLLIGADGAYSSVRKDMMRRTRMDFSQKYIPHGYMELSMPATVDEEYAMDSHHLHIWPRHSFMMIALPNTDKSFTCTLFMPFDNFEELTTEGKVLEFFQEYFPDAIKLFGEEYLVQAVLKNPVPPLISIKCSPYHYKDSAVIVGDAAHAMVPFYGQGMNCGFEDCLVLDQCLYGGHKNKHTLSRELCARQLPDGQMDLSMLKEYTLVRHPDATAIVDLAMYNYIEMRSSVLSYSYRIRKVIESTLHKWIPASVTPLYTMVSFSQRPYSHVWRQWKRQTRWFNMAMNTSILMTTLSTSLVVGAVAWRHYRGR